MAASSGLASASVKEVRDLLSVATGLNLGYEFDFADLLKQPVEFDPGQETPLVTQALYFGNDGSGNYWAIEVDEGGLRDVLFLCHDPAMIVYEAPSLAVFLKRVLCTDKAAMAVGTDDGAWKKPNGGGIERDGRLWFDLRGRQPGRSVPLCVRHGQRDSLRREGQELLFSMPAPETPPPTSPRGWWGWLFG